MSFRISYFTQVDLKQVLQFFFRWWFQIFLIVNPTPGNDPIWLVHIFPTSFIRVASTPNAFEHHDHADSGDGLGDGSCDDSKMMVYSDSKFRVHYTLQN